MRACSRCFGVRSGGAEGDIPSVDAIGGEIVGWRGIGGGRYAYHSLRGESMFGKFCVAALLTCGMAAAQTPLKARTDAPVAASAAALTFDVASVRPSLDFRSAAMQAAMRAGNMPKFGPHVEGLRA
jgi:hypothetical protein